MPQAPIPNDKSLRTLVGGDWVVLTSPEDARPSVQRISFSTNSLITVQGRMFRRMDGKDKENQGYRIRPYTEAEVPGLFAKIFKMW